MAGCYVAVPGLVDRDIGPLRLAPNLGWESVDVVGLADRSPADAARYRSGWPTRRRWPLGPRPNRSVPSDVHSFFYVSGEIGIGGAAVIDGAVVPGRHGWSGEIGHTLIDPAGPLCGCGATGCLEQYAGKDALMRAAGLDLDLPIESLIATAGSERTRPRCAAGGRRPGYRAGQRRQPDRRRYRGAGWHLRAAGAVPAAGNPPSADGRVLSHPWSPVTVQAAAATDYAALTGGAMTVIGEIVQDPNAWIQRVASG